MTQAPQKNGGTRAAGLAFFAAGLARVYTIVAPVRSGAHAWAKSLII